MHNKPEPDYRCMVEGCGNTVYVPGEACEKCEREYQLENPVEVCTICQQRFCAGCLETVIFGEDEYHVCKACKGSDAEKAYKRAYVEQFNRTLG